MHLRFRQVRYFVEIVDSGSMTRAAERLNLAPTALSLQIKKLEEQFGVDLLERHARGVRPTAMGQDFYDCACRILGLLDETEQFLAGKGDAKGCCRIGMSSSLLHAIGLGALLPRAERPSSLVVELVEGVSSDLMGRLEGGDIDFVLGWVDRHPPSIHVVDLVEESLVFVTSRRRDGPCRAIRLEDALASDLIRIGRRSMSWDLVSRRAASAGLPMNSGRVVESADLVRRMLRDGLGTAILPITFIDPERRAGDVHVYPLTGEPLTRRLSLAWREPAARAGIEGSVIAYIEGLVGALHALTLPHSRIVASLAEALTAAGVASAGSRAR